MPEYIRNSLQRTQALLSEIQVAVSSPQPTLFPSQDSLLFYSYFFQIFY